MKSIYIIAIPAVLILAMMMNWAHLFPASGGLRIMNSSKESVQETKTIPVADAPTIIVESDAGNVELVGADEGSVRIAAEKYASTDAEAQKMTFSVEDRDNTVHIIYSDPDRSQRDRHIDFKIHAPKNADLLINTGGGNIQAAGFSRGITGHTDGGNLHVASVSGAIQLDTDGGNIDCGGLDGTVDLTTGGGNIEAFGDLRGTVALRTGGGNISAESVAGEVKAETGAGNIYVGGRLTGNSELSSGAGNIDTIVPDDSDLSVYAATSMGHIHNAFGLQTSTGQRLGPVIVNGHLGSGTNRLNIQTGIGNVSLENR